MDCFVSPCGLPRKDGKNGVDCFGDKSPRKDGKGDSAFLRGILPMPSLRDSVKLRRIVLFRHCEILRKQNRGNPLKLESQDSTESLESFMDFMVIFADSA